MGNYLENVRAKQAMEEELCREEHGKGIFRKSFDTDILELMLIGDEHIGAKNYCHQLHEKVLESAYEKGRSIIHMGDGIEAATRNSVGSGVYDQEEIIDKQMRHFMNLYTPFVEEGLVLGFHPGNHEMRAYKDDGINITKQMCREMKGRYFGIGKVSMIRVGNQTYSLYTTHGSSGARLPYTKIKGALDMEKIVDVDIYAMGHVHQLSHHIREFHSIDKRNKKLDINHKHFLLTGSYLEYWGSYAQVMNMEPSRLGSPIIQLYGDERRIKVILQ